MVYYKGELIEMLFLSHFVLSLLLYILAVILLAFTGATSQTGPADRTSDRTQRAVGLINRTLPQRKSAKLVQNLIERGQHHL